MTMTVVKRVNMFTAPFAPLFISGAGEAYYRVGLTDLRKVVMDTGVDALFTNAMLGSPGAPNYNIALLVGNFYVGSPSMNGGVGASVLNFVNLVTGAVTNQVLFDPTAAQTQTGIFGAIGDKICIVQTTGANPWQIWSRTPPNNSANRDTSSAVSGNTILSFSNFNNTGSLLTYQTPTAALYRCSFTPLPGNAVITAYIPPQPIGIYNPVFYGTQDSTFPWGVREWNNYIYLFANGQNAGNGYPIILRINKTTGVVETQILDAVTPLVNANAINNFWIDYQFQRIYWSVSGANRFRIWGAYLTTWPLDQTDFVDVDTGNLANNSVRGLFTTPPYVYAMKTAGPTFGDQYIRIYDSALDPGRRRSKRRGGEIWELIPEIGDYLI